jgi:DNA-binding MarR family transcriptional regulator
MVTSRRETGQPEVRNPTVDAVRALARAARGLERASSEISLAQYRVLSAIATGHERASRIAERLELGRPTISAAVTSLSRNGLLVRDDVPVDQRATALRLTPAGEELLAQIESDMVDRLDALLARTPDGNQVVRSLVWLGQAIEAASADRAVARRSPER